MEVFLKKNILLVTASVLLVVLLLTGSACVSKGTYEQATNDLAAAQVSIQKLQADLTSTQGTLDTTQANLTTAQNDLAKSQDANKTLQTNLDTANSQIKTLQDEAGAAKSKINELTNLQDLSSKQIKLDSDRISSMEKAGKYAELIDALYSDLWQEHKVVSDYKFISNSDWDYTVIKLSSGLADTVVDGYVKTLTDYSVSDAIWADAHYQLFYHCLEQIKALTKPAS